MTEGATGPDGAEHAPVGGIRSFLRYLAVQPWRRGLLYSEFRRFGLAGRPRAEARLWLGAYGAAKLALRLNRNWGRRGIVGDKLLFDALMAGAGLPVPELRAVFGRPPPLGVPRIGDEAGFRQLLSDPGALPLFGKPALGQRSEDALAIAGFDATADCALLSDGGRKALGTILAELRAGHRGGGFLFQAMIRQHPELTSICGPTVGTLRLVTLVHRQEVRIIAAVWKVPRPGMVADNLWRGNLAAAVDVASGRLGPALARPEASTPRLTHHPDTGAAIAGVTLPHWPATLQKLRRAAGLLHMLPLVGWDIALDEAGPVFVEANASPSLDTWQVVEGRGALAGEAGAALAAALAEARAAGRAQRRDRRRRRRRLARRGLGMEG